MFAIKRALSKLKYNAAWRSFEFFEKLGIHLMRKHYYSPIPDTRLLTMKNNLWEKESKLMGIDMNLEKQLYLLEKVFPQYSEEYNFPVNKTAVPYEFCLNNPMFGLQPAAVLHCMIRHFRPRTIIEVGSGNSTYVSSRACIMNQKDDHPSKLLSLEPYPNDILKKGFPGLSGLIIKKVEEVNLDFFSKLGNNDILFIDSSHVVKIGNDVNLLYLEVLPRLKKGVFVHIHDIFFPHQYPKDWVIKMRRFWSEQYILQAFLCFNNAYEVIFSNYYMNLKYPEKMKSVFPVPKDFHEYHFPSSFWIRKIV